MKRAISLRQSFTGKQLKMYLLFLIKNKRTFQTKQFLVSKVPDMINDQIGLMGHSKFAWGNFHYEQLKQHECINNVITFIQSRYKCFQQDQFNYVRARYLKQQQQKYQNSSQQSDEENDTKNSSDQLLFSRLLLQYERINKIAPRINKKLSKFIKKLQKCNNIKNEFKQRKSNYIQEEIPISNIFQKKIQNNKNQTLLCSQVPEKVYKINSDFQTTITNPSRILVHKQITQGQSYNADIVKKSMQAKNVSSFSQQNNELSETKYSLKFPSQQSKQTDNVKQLTKQLAKNKQIMLRKNEQVINNNAQNDIYDEEITENLKLSVSFLKEPKIYKDNMDAQRKTRTHWTIEQAKIFAQYIEDHKHVINQNAKRVNFSYFEQMSTKVMTKTATQCKVHYHMLKMKGSLKNQIDLINQKYSRFLNQSKQLFRENKNSAQKASSQEAKDQSEYPIPQKQAVYNKSEQIINKKGFQSGKQLKLPNFVQKLNQMKVVLQKTEQMLKKFDQIKLVQKINSNKYAKINY